MARKVMVRNVFTDGGVQTLGLPELVDEAEFVQEASGMAPAANIAAVAVPFADLTAAANAHNALLAALKTAGLMIAD